MRPFYMICCCVALLCCSAAARAQDAQFSQQYANRLYLNPAFAGLDRNWSVLVAHRNQWPLLTGAFITNQITADYRLPDKKSAFGVLVQQDKTGIGGLQNLQAAGLYAYHTNITVKWAFSAGLQAAVASLRLNQDNLVFGDQLSDNGLVAVRSAEANSFEPTSYGSFSTGGLIYSDQFWFGLAAAHLNKPSYGFGQTTALPIRFTANTGYKFYVRSYEERGKVNELSITPTLTYTRQQNLSRTDVGLYTIYTPLTLGVIYKGAPVTGGADQDQSVALIAGLQLEQFKVGYSHDFGIKGFGRQAGGANEISLVFEQVDLKNIFNSSAKRRINRNIACPAF